MKPIYYIDRATHEHCEEKVYGAQFIKLLYGDNFISRFIGTPLAYSLARFPWFSAFYGHLQNKTSSKEKVIPFIKKFHVDPTEFANDPSEYVSFNDFFTRKLKSSARPIVSGKDIAIIPADGRYYFYQNIKTADGFVVKGKKFDLADLLQDKSLAEAYAEGSMAIARLCPTDYHRYHFPCDCTAAETILINGLLHSVNPTAIKKNVEIFAENKRTICILDSDVFGKVLFLEIGATCVGSIHQTYQPNSFCAKGDEKGYFSFGGSSLILLFPPNNIQFDQDLINASTEGIEIKCLMGQSMGRRGIRR